MNKAPSRPILSRRDFLKLLAAAGVTTAGGYLLYTYAPWLNYDQATSNTWRPFEMGSTSSVQMRELIRYATLAANGHNTQPWTFAIKENVIEIHPDYARHLSAVDPHERELWISLGCALENLLVAARAVGYASEVTYPDTADLIHIRLTPDTPQREAMFDAISLRQNTRSEYDGQPIKMDDLEQVQTISLESGVVLRFVLNPADMETTVGYVNQGNLNQYADEAFIDELIHWLRFNKEGNSGPHSMVSTRAVGAIPKCRAGWDRYLWRALSLSSKLMQMPRSCRTSPGAVVIASETDDKTAWVRTGQVYERLALKMTSLNIKSAFLNQPIEVANVRGQFQSAMGLGNALPQLLVRFGYADPMPRSLRRSVEQVII